MNSNKNTNWPCKKHTHTKRDIKNKFVHLWTECPANRTNSVPRTMNFYWNIDAEKTENIFLSIFCLLLVWSSGLRWNIKPFGYSIFFSYTHLGIMHKRGLMENNMTMCVSQSIELHWPYYGMVYGEGKFSRISSFIQFWNKMKKHRAIARRFMIELRIVDGRISGNVMRRVSFRIPPYFRRAACGCCCPT